MPFAGYIDHADCVSKNSDKGDPDAYCATIERKVKKGFRVIERDEVLVKGEEEMVIPISFNGWYGDEVSIVDSTGHAIDGVITGFVPEGLRVRPL